LQLPLLQMQKLDKAGIPLSGFGAAAANVA
jgi:hypothetical protein